MKIKKTNHFVIGLVTMIFASCSSYQAKSSMGMENELARKDHHKARDISSEKVEENRANEASDLGLSLRGFGGMRH
ncbi:hypothetical protein N9N67_10090 [Bacteriovoracaceae bacterium]|nr:hypothetical protein [Bacteriovoracaceae bacterium]